jgi:anti-sigma factor RsiW
MNCRELEELAPLYLSGELEEDRKVLFHTHLAECRSCAQQMEQQAAMDARLRKALCTGLPYAGEIERSVWGRIARERSRRWMFLAAAAALLIAAVMAYRMRPERLYADAALDHRREVTERQPRRWRTDPAEIEKLAARYDLADVAALAPAGYRLEHAKMCGIDGQPALHLVYTNGAREFSVFVRPGGGVEPVSAHSVGSEHLARFRTARHEAVIVTDGSSGECLQFARFAAAAL